MKTKADEARDKLLSKPNLIVGKPETFYDESSVDDNLYTPVLNKWIREIKRQLIPVVCESNERLRELQEKLLKVRGELVEIEADLKHEYDKDKRESLNNDAAEIRNEIIEFECEWNSLDVCKEWLNTVDGSLWLQKVLTLSDTDFIAKKATDILPTLYIDRLRTLGLDGYNYVIREERALAQDMSIMTMGIGLAIGDPGAGKTAFIVAWIFLLKYLFGYKAILDFPPRRPFGDWYLFNTEKIKSEAERQQALHSGKLEGLEDIKDDNGKSLPIEARWAAAQYSLLFRRAGAGFDEYSDYFPRLGQGRTRMGGALFNFHRKWRHNDLLILGATPRIEEVDINMCQNYITHHIIVQPYPEAPDECTKATIYPRRIVAGQYVIDVKREPFEFYLWGLKPRDYLGGECFYHSFNTKNPQKLKLARRLSDED